MARNSIRDMVNSAKESVHGDFGNSVSAVKNEIDNLKRSTLDSM